MIMRDPYVYFNTNILINKFNIENEDELNIVERNFASKRLQELRNKNLKGDFDFKYLKAIHKYIFQDIYKWAGETRNVNIAKGNSLFCSVEYIESYAKDIFNSLKKQKYLKESAENKKDFAFKLGKLFLDINALHPFREGNGRSQREFIRKVAEYNGYQMSFKNFLSEDMKELSSLVDIPEKLIKKFEESLEKI